MKSSQARSRRESGNVRKDILMWCQVEFLWTETLGCICVRSQSKWVNESGRAYEETDFTELTGVTQKEISWTEETFDWAHLELFEFKLLFCPCKWKRLDMKDLSDFPQDLLQPFTATAHMFRWRRWWCEAKQAVRGSLPAVFHSEWNAAVFFFSPHNICQTITFVAEMSFDIMEVLYNG